MTDEEWAFVTPDLALMRMEASHRVHDPREIDAQRWIVHTGAPWLGALWALPTNFPP